MAPNDGIEYLDLPTLMRLPGRLEPAASAVLSLIQTGKRGQLVHASGVAGSHTRTVGAISPDGRCAARQVDRQP